MNWIWKGKKKFSFLVGSDDSRETPTPGTSCWYQKAVRTSNRNMQDYRAIISTPALIIYSSHTEWFPLARIRLFLWINFCTWMLHLHVVKNLQTHLLKETRVCIIWVVPDRSPLSKTPCLDLLVAFYLAFLVTPPTKDLPHALHSPQCVVFNGIE